MDQDAVGLTAQGERKVLPMQLTVDVPQPIQQTAARQDASRWWILGQIAADEDGGARTSGRPYSFFADCECPDDCLRDHENE